MDETKKVNPTDYKNKFQRENYDRIATQVKKGMRDELRNVAASKGHKSLNSYIIALLEKDSGLKLL